ncbi:aminopeptidase N [Nitrospirillum amazonense]|uniref:Aminopeptidase n=1 Tax=Nitrospirillum amazonense TaxID=28077 RepID=A0A560ETV2_9PROT|nr:M1 family metallopeptidase [Nitrospirillum amazonense]TWB12798.1 aminopeptidase N [Nitrospirillum amazonense]
MAFTFHAQTSHRRNWLAVAVTTFLLLAPDAGLAQTALDVEAVPRGMLADTVQPTAYRLDLTILPEQPRFNGHAEIDVQLQREAAQIFLHGKDLTVIRATARTSSGTVLAQWSEVERSGVARLIFADPLPAGAVTLSFDYSAPYTDTPSGFYHLKSGGEWYSWTHLEPSLARQAFPSFDEPRFKTPFTVVIRTHPGLTAVSNMPEVAVEHEDDLDAHRFAPTPPLPTYLVALNVGPFIQAVGTVPPTPQRPAPLPLRILAPQAQAGRLDTALRETPPILSLLENYFGQAFPFPKLDQIATPDLSGAMENAGADLYGERILLISPDASTEDRRHFGDALSHELSHQWFGDLVTPRWWDDTWLNESFANWMGFHIGDAWRPDLGIGIEGKVAAFRAMETDALDVGRPIHQPVTTTDEAGDTFDTITYGKGAQVVGMIAAYLGEERFKTAVRLHLSRHPYGTATADDFFQALSDTAGDPQILAAMHSFIDQPGVPLVTISRAGNGLVATQTRYTPLSDAVDSHAKLQTWSIPFCLRAGPAQACRLLGAEPTSLEAPPAPFLMPNVDGAGYYRFDLPSADWRQLIAHLPELPTAEALAADDSLWASFAAGRTGAGLLLAETRSLAAHPNTDAALAGVTRLGILVHRGYVTPEAMMAYRRFVSRILTPQAQALGLDPRAGTHDGEPDERRNRRQQVALLLVREAADAPLSARLAVAAQQYLAGDRQAVSESLMDSAFIAYARRGGLPAVRRLVERALSSDDPVFRDAALDAAASTDMPVVATWLLTLEDARLRRGERMALLHGLAAASATRDLTARWILDSYDRVIGAPNGAPYTRRLPFLMSAHCSATMADEVERRFGVLMRQDGDALDFDRMQERTRRCASLKMARSVELSRALMNMDH